MSSKIRISRHQLEYFKRIARRENPKEILAYLVGEVVSPTLTVVNKLKYTKEYAQQTTAAVQWFDEELEIISQEAEEEGLTIVGDLHSHPNYWPVLSATDHTAHIITQNRVTGVYAFMGRMGKICFWLADSSLPLTIDYGKH